MRPGRPGRGRRGTPGGPVTGRARERVLSCRPVENRRAGRAALSCRRVENGYSQLSSWTMWRLGLGGLSQNVRTSGLGIAGCAGWAHDSPMANRLDRSPNASLRRIGTSTRACVDRIVCTYLEATTEQVAEGAAWYADAHGVALDLARTGGISVEHAATVISHLSPRTSWTRNVTGAWSLVTTGIAPRCLRSNVDRARASLLSSDPLDTFGPRAPKTRRFARNILGDRDAVTVDVWAVRVALGDRPDAETLLRRAGVYEAIEHAYRLAATRLGVDPTDVQATTWIVVRGRSGWAEADAALESIAETYDAAAPSADDLARAGW
jgi:hypothetical protein